MVGKWGRLLTDKAMKMTFSSQHSAILGLEAIAIDAPTGPVTIYPQRTNNILEQILSQRQRVSPETGNNSMHGALQTRLADTPIVKNPDNPEYMKTLLA